MNIKEIAEDIALYLTSKYIDSCSIESLERECYEAVEDLKGDIFDETYSLLKERGFNFY